MSEMIAHGNAEPLPEYVSAFALADKLGVSVTEIDGVDAYWIGAAAAMLEAERIYRDTTERRKG